MGHKELPVTHLRKVMLEELQRRKFSSATIRGYLGALLVSCDCDVAGWRKHMLQMQPKNPVWSAPIDILSPLDLAGAVLPSIHVALLTGAADNIVPPSICSGRQGARSSSPAASACIWAMSAMAMSAAAGASISRSSGRR